MCHHHHSLFLTFSFGGEARGNRPSDRGRCRSSSTEDETRASPSLSLSF
jgi:hypothetical protein